MTDSILIEFNGWVMVDAKDVKFVYVGEQTDPAGTINGKQWNKLPAMEQTEYILQDFAECYRNAHDGEFDNFDVEFVTE